MELIKKANLQDQIYLLGKRTDVPAIMNALDVHVLSSLGEAFPNVVAEAMACDTPCVTTDVGDAGLIVGNPDWVVPPKSPKLLAKAILNAVAFIQEEGRDAVALSCRQRIVDNFSLERMIGVYYSLWNSAAEKQG
jgi:glycosyltransferase involved in cell wall biosynthesis